MKLAIIGCRWYTDWTEFSKVLQEYQGDITEIISGGATGTDTMAEAWASKNGIPIKVFPAHWDIYGKAAGPIRNRKIIEESDQVLAFWDGESRGTWNSISIATSLKKPVDIISIAKPEVS